MYIGVGVGWKQRCKSCQLLRQLDNQDTVYCSFFFFLLAVTIMLIEFDQIVRGGEPNSAQAG